MNNLGFGWKDVILILAITGLFYCLGLIVNRIFKKNKGAWKIKYCLGIIMSSVLTVKAITNFNANKLLATLLCIPAIIVFIYTMLFGKKMMKKGNQSIKS